MKIDDGCRDARTARAEEGIGIVTDSLDEVVSLAAGAVSTRVRGRFTTEGRVTGTRTGSGARLVTTDRRFTAPAWVEGAGMTTRLSRRGSTIDRALVGACVDGAALDTGAWRTCCGTFGAPMLEGLRDSGAGGGGCAVGTGDGRASTRLDGGARGDRPACGAEIGGATVASVGFAMAGIGCAGIAFTGA